MKTEMPIGPKLIELIILAYNAMRPLLLEGATVIGKSQIFEAAAAALKVEYRCRDLSLMEPPDLAGLPYFKGERLHYAPPTFLPVGGKGLLVFEELNRAPRHVRVPLLQLLTTGKLNDYKLPDGWLVCAAINPDSGEYQVDPLDPAHVARFINVAAVPDVQQWVVWGEKAGLDPALLSFVGSTPSIFEAPRSNPRAWKFVNDVIVAADQTPMREHVCVSLQNVRLPRSVGVALSRASILRRFSWFVGCTEYVESRRDAHYPSHFPPGDRLPFVDVMTTHFADRF